MNEAVRSNWYDNQSAEAREYFKVPVSDVIIKEGDDIPDGSYTKITPIPVVVFWTDAAINSLSLSRQYLSPTTPTSWLTFEDLWNGTIPASDPESSWGVAANDSGRPVIDTDYRMLIQFGPSTYSGWNTVHDWDKVYHGGSLTTGNNEAVKVIAKKNAEIVAELDSVFKPFFEANFAAGGYELSDDQYDLEYIEADNNTKVRVTMRYDTSVMAAFGTDAMYSTREMIINLKVQPNNYVIDIVMCIDATGSMQNTLNKVKASAMTFNAGPAPGNRCR